jgi:hypothetical protein
VADIPLVCQQRDSAAPDRSQESWPDVSIAARAVRLHAKAGTLAGEERWCMVKYLFLLYGTSETLPEPGTEEFARMRADWDAATGAMARAGVLIDCAPLQPPAAATTLRVRDGETLLTDGPAAEIKEHFGGYTLAECADLDEALKWAATLPVAQVGKVEVRPVVQVVAPAEQSAG